jgi:DDE_Tnp_1-associated/Transposase DDE domain
VRACLKVMGSAKRDDLLFENIWLPHPIVSGQKVVKLSVLHASSPLSSSADPSSDECDISGLLTMLESVTDPRSPRGRIYGLSFLLAVSFIAVLAGAKNFYAIERRIQDLPSSLIAKLGGTWCYFSQGYLFPGEKTVRMLLNELDAGELDRIFGAWLFGNTRADDDELLVLAIDGKAMRGAWTDENEKFTLFSAMIHDLGVTVAQVAVPGDTNEITQVENLLDALPIDEDQAVLVTMDAAHTQRDTAEHIAGERGFDYIAAIKGNQPTLQQAVIDAIVPVLNTDPEFDVKELATGGSTAGAHGQPTPRQSTSHTLNESPAYAETPTC